MRSRVYIRPQARSDLQEMTLRFAAGQENSPFDFLIAADDVMRRLAAKPDLDTPHDFANPELSAICACGITFFGHCYIFYRPLPNGIDVIRVLRGTSALAEIVSQKR